MRNRAAFFQRASASLMIPLTFLPFPAVLVALGTVLGMDPLLTAGLELLRTWLPLFFAMGIAVGFAQGEGMAVLSAAAGYLTMMAVAVGVAGDSGVNFGVLGGVAIGAVSTWLFGYTARIRLPEFLALFSGRRMGPILAALAGVVLGWLFGLTWPGFHRAVVLLGEWIYAAGGTGAFVYGGIVRLLIPTGLHHILMQLVDYQMGAWTDPATGQVVVGEYIRFLHGDPGAGRLLSGFFLTLAFGPLGAALALTHEARPEQRRRVSGMMLTAVLTAMVLGITEPVEFAFIFASPLLFVLHVFFSAVASFLGYMLDIHLGGYALPMALINWHRQQNGWLLLPLGAVWTVLYYVTFRLIIRWRRPPVLGQEPVTAGAGAGATGAAAGAAPGAAAGASAGAGAGRGAEAAAVSGAVKGTPENAAGRAHAVAAGGVAAGVAAGGGAGGGAAEAAAILAALGGPANVRSLTACMTRLRVEVQAPDMVDEAALRALGAAGVICAGSSIQVVIGTRVGDIERALQEELAKAAPVQENGDEA